MPDKKGRVTGVNGNLVRVRFDESVLQNEVATINCKGTQLKGEVIRIRGQEAEMQVFEDTSGVSVGDEVAFTDDLLSVELGPGILKQVYDGLQNPLYKLAEKSGFFLERGLYLDPIDRDVDWDYSPTVKVGDSVKAGDTVGTVPEGIFKHRVMIPFSWSDTWTVTWVVDPGSYNVDTVVCKVKNSKGQENDVTMVQKWPIKKPIVNYKEKVLPVDTLVTKKRLIDSFFPVARGGTFCTPGPFGAGKTVLQHSLSQHSEADIVIVAACGERAGEVVEVLREFPHLSDPRTGKTLMDRTIIICNTSSMPVAAREASVYTAVTLAEYYRQMGLHVLLLADSTSRWAQALREMSGRLEEIPGEEAFPAYLESLIAGFYERAGLVELDDGSTGSVTIGGTVSPAGGNFEEPVTQGTLKVVGCFLGLSRARANARRFPSIDPLESWSKYKSVVDNDQVTTARSILKRSHDVHQMMMVVGEEGTSNDDYIIYQKGEFLDAVYLQQDTFDDVDGACSVERQQEVFNTLMMVLTAKFALGDKDKIRTYFNRLRQLFIDWNFIASGTEAYDEKVKLIEAMIKEAQDA
ncbi:MAG: V-type ATP synthase subunit A [Planctomycetes bacterium]|nr:V-type ATP synthase subunit A [Planctomycetota bacterium]